jgi:serine protease Do
LGARVREVDEVLVDQLGLQKGQGQVIVQVQPDSAAAKAGIQAGDILLELDGKVVSGDARSFDEMLEKIKPNTPVDAVVLRKGKKETIKGLSLPEAAPQKGLPGLEKLPKGLPGLEKPQKGLPRPEDFEKGFPFSGVK